MMSHDHLSKTTKKKKTADLRATKTSTRRLSRLIIPETRSEVVPASNYGRCSSVFKIMLSSKSVEAGHNKGLRSLHHWIPILSGIIFTLISMTRSYGFQEHNRAVNWTTSFAPSPPSLLPLPFGSTRYIYPRNSHLATNNHKRLHSSHYRYDIVAMNIENNESEIDHDGGTAVHQQDIGLLRDQLIDIRKKFENQLMTSSGRRQVTLGSACLSSKDCSLYVENSHCRLDNYTCSCLSNHVEYNSTTCLPSALLGFKCSIDSQCEQRVANSFCSSSSSSSSPSPSPSSDHQSNTTDSQSSITRVCSCKSNFIAYRRDKCLPGSQVNEYCLSNEQCRLNDKHSYCQWKITNIYGTCKCPPNYKQVSVATTRLARGLKCVPRLGDVCLSDDECQLATPNSMCRADTNTTQSSRYLWRTSQADSRQLCLCRPGFVMSANKLDCLEVNKNASKSPPEVDLSKLESNFTSSSGTAIIALSPPMADKRQPQYDLVVSSMTPATLLEGLASPPEPPLSTSNSGKATPRLMVSSLGKKCLSSAECQARDPHSDCIGGICECLKPTNKCRANSTGCHGDTFQCRNGQCISWYFVCDQFRNCADGSDEDECQWSKCPPEAFQCSNGQCLARSKVCNGPKDCSDGSDEFQCSSGSLPVFHDHPASSVGANETGSHRAAPTAANWLSPEAGRNLTAARNGCHPKAFTCSNGQCLPAYVFCNAVRDCLDGSDEREQLCERPTTLKGVQEQELLRQQQQLLLLPGVTETDHQTEGAEQQPAGQVGKKQAAEGGSLVGRRPNETDNNNNNNNSKRTDTNPMAANVSGRNSTKATSAVIKPIAFVHLEDSPLVKADRLDINKMLASLKSPNGHQRQPKTEPPPNESRQSVSISRRRSRLLTEAARLRQQRIISEQQALANEQCPRYSFACANGRCRSTAILCSGVDGCGDNSDENQCEVCLCEAP